MHALIPCPASTWCFVGRLCCKDLSCLGLNKTMLVPVLSFPATGLSILQNSNSLSKVESLRKHLNLLKHRPVSLWRNPVNRVLLIKHCNKQGEYSLSLNWLLRYQHYDILPKPSTLNPKLNPRRQTLKSRLLAGSGGLESLELERYRWRRRRRGRFYHVGNYSFAVREINSSYYIGEPL